MKTYEITFIDIGFLLSPELWKAWFFAGLFVGVFVLLRQFTGSKEVRARRLRRIKKMGAGWTVFAICFSVVAWPVAAFVWIKSRIEP